MHIQLPRLVAALLLAAALLPGRARAEGTPSSDQMVQMLRVVDDRQKNTGDYRSVAYLERKERGKEDTASQVTIFRRDADEKLMILFTAPKSEAGKGYLRLDKNLFLYDPSVGKWERRTDRERIGGTDSRRQDFDQSKLAEEYAPTYTGAEKLGKLDVHHLTLAARAGVDVAYPTVELFLDVSTGNLLKRQDKALSGKLMRTTYYPKWNKLFSESKKADVYFPAEVRIFDEVEKGNSTMIVFREIDLKALDANIFTKAWLESKSR